jgi:hypothetical protein
MIFINLIPQMIDIWTCTFNNMDEGTESYSIDPALFKTLGKIFENLGSTMPSLYGCQVPSIALPHHGGATAEAWSIFGGYLGPCVLCGQFQKTKYYCHFVHLIKLVNKITLFKIQCSNIASIQEGFTNWVKKYKK